MPGCSTGQSSRLHHSITGIQAPEEPSNVMLELGLKWKTRKERLGLDVHGNIASA